MRNAKQSIRRTVAGLLAGAMLLGMTPLAAFAEGSSSASGDWQFKAFGTSTAAGVNTIADGADINGKVTLNSCTIKDDGTIDKKGGKFVADSPADGLSFYYTTIDPTTQNFYLQADVTIDYVNPAPDGQEDLPSWCATASAAPAAISRIKFLSSAPSSLWTVLRSKTLWASAATPASSPTRRLLPTTSSRIVRRSARRPSSRATPTV